MHQYIDFCGKACNSAPNSKCGYGSADCVKTLSGSSLSIEPRQLINLTPTRQAGIMTLYQPVSLSEGEERGHLSSKSEREESLRVVPKRHSYSRLALPASIVLLCISFVNLFIAKNLYRPTDDICTARTSVWC
jgi:hypothetical protein